VIAGTVKLTLTSAYGLKPGDDLRVSIFDHLGG
jgi:protein involved in polysaccharide export with SLBB domain